jgi:hypothetical protein
MVGHVLNVFKLVLTKAVYKREVLMVVKSEDVVIVNLFELKKGDTFLALSSNNVYLLIEYDDSDKYNCVDINSGELDYIGKNVQIIKINCTLTYKISQ